MISGRKMALTWFVREVDGLGFAEHDGGTGGIWRA